jgi:hypothetical protein
MKNEIYLECDSIIEDIGEETIVRLYRRLKKDHEQNINITLATLNKAVEIRHVNELFEKKKSATKVINEVPVSKSTVYRILGA